MEMSALVNYIQPTHFHSFEIADSKCLSTSDMKFPFNLGIGSSDNYFAERNKSFECSSFVETQATALLKELPVDFVK